MPYRRRPRPSWQPRRWRTSQKLSEWRAASVSLRCRYAQFTDIILIFHANRWPAHVPPHRAGAAAAFARRHMATCPECDAEIEVDEFDVDKGDQLSCPECGSNLEVTGLSPIELDLAPEDDEDEDDDDDLDDDEEGDDDLDDVDDEEKDEDW